MNDRVPDSSGLPLRAMVMMLLFLGAVFLLVGLQALLSNGSDDDTASRTTTTTTSSVSSTSSSSKPPAPKADVRVYNISDREGLASRAADQLKDAGWNVTETANLVLTDVTATTVYYGRAAGELEAAEAVGKLLDVPVEERVSDPDIADQPPGVIVVVAE
jgi:hypothetical protein